MPKTLVVLRHAKSAWPDGVPDLERPLSKRGRRDAPAVGRWLRDQGVELDVALVSSARRTVETFELLAAELDAPPRPVLTDDVYGAGPLDLLELVRGLPDEAEAALVLGHNPSIGMLAALLDHRVVGRLEFKTSAVAVYDVGARWADVSPGETRLLASAVPRG